MKSGIKKKMIAKQLGVDPNTLSSWISGKSPISFEKAIHLSEILNCELNDLYKK